MLLKALAYLRVVKEVVEFGPLHAGRKPRAQAPGKSTASPPGAALGGGCGAGGEPSAAALIWHTYCSLV